MTSLPCRLMTRRRFSELPGLLTFQVSVPARTGPDPAEVGSSCRGVCVVRRTVPENPRAGDMVVMTEPTTDPSQIDMDSVRLHGRPLEPEERARLLEIQRQIQTVRQLGDPTPHEDERTFLVHAASLDLEDEELADAAGLLPHSSPPVAPAPEACSHCGRNSEMIVLEAVWRSLNAPLSVRDAVAELVALTEAARRDGNTAPAQALADLVGVVVAQELTLRSMHTAAAERRSINEIDVAMAQMREMLKSMDPIAPERSAPTLTVVPDAKPSPNAKPQAAQPEGERRRVRWSEVVPGTMARVVRGKLRGLHIGDVVLRWPEPHNGFTGTWLVFQGEPTHQNLPAWGWMPENAIPWGSELELEVLVEGLEQRECADPQGLLRRVGA